MNISHLAIDNISQINVGDTVILVDSYYSRTTSIKRMTVKRILKTKFELVDRNGLKEEYRTDVRSYAIHPYGKPKDTGFGTSRTVMYPDTEKVRAWCIQEKRKVKAQGLKYDLTKLVKTEWPEEINTEEAYDTAREIAHKAQLFRDLIKEILDVEAEAQTKLEAEADEETDKEAEE